MPLWWWSIRISRLALMLEVAFIMILLLIRMMTVVMMMLRRTMVLMMMLLAVMVLLMRMLLVVVLLGLRRTSHILHFSPASVGMGRRTVVIRMVHDELLLSILHHYSCYMLIMHSFSWIFLEKNWIYSFPKSFCLFFDLH